MALFLLIEISAVFIWRNSRYTDVRPFHKQAFGKASTATIYTYENFNSKKLLILPLERELFCVINKDTY